MRLAFFVAITTIVLAGCTMNQNLERVDAQCYQLPGKMAQAQCFNQRERPVWAYYSPATLGDFDVFAARRLQLGQAYDTGRLTYAQYSYNFQSAKGFLIDAANRAAAQQQADQNEAMRGVLLAIAQSEQMRANAYGDVANALQQSRPIYTPPPAPQHTVCKPSFLNPGQVECTTTTY